MRKKLITAEIGFFIKVLVLEEEHVDGAAARVNIPEPVECTRRKFGTLEESLFCWKTLRPHLIKSKE